MRPAASRTPAPDCHVECLAMKLVGELDAGNRHVQFDERGRETECWPSAPSHRARPRLYRRRRCSSCSCAPLRLTENSTRDSGGESGLGVHPREDHAWAAARFISVRWIVLLSCGDKPLAAMAIEDLAALS